MNAIQSCYGGEHTVLFGFFHIGELTVPSGSSCNKATHRHRVPSNSLHTVNRADGKGILIGT